MTKIFRVIILFLFFGGILFAQVHYTSQPHAGDITALAAVKNKSEVFSIGTDGFVIKWDTENGEHFQISDYPIQLIAENPKNNDIAVYETDGFSINRISVWDWKTQTKKFTKRLTDTVVSLSYSAKGTYIMIGTTSINGILFLDSSRGNLISGKIKDPPGIVSFAQTSATENTCMLYSPIGYLTYITLSSGKQKRSFSIDNNLAQPTSFKNNVLFAGVKNSSIFIYQATDGVLQGKISARNPRLVKTKNLNNLYYLEQQGYSAQIKMIEAESGYVKTTPTIIKTISFKKSQNITDAVLIGDELFIGTKSGELFLSDIYASAETEPVKALSVKLFDMVYDIAEYNELFYFLTEKSLFKSNVSEETITRIGDNSGYTHFLPYNDNLILWSKNQKKAVKMNGTVLLQPKNILRNLHVIEDMLITIEGSTNVGLYDFEKKTYELIYTGTGIQDAVLFDKNLYVTKSAASTPKTALVQVNIKTKETVPLSIKADMIFSVSKNSETNNSFYGVSLYEKEQKTEIFTYYPHTKQYSPIFKFADEDTTAFTYYKNNILFTNLGKTRIHAYNLKTRRDTLLKRVSSLPVKICANAEYFVVLNKDGSVSWFDKKTNTLLKNWYMTVNEGLIRY